jgi:ketosteroid isomerase-like protein
VNERPNVATVSRAFEAWNTGQLEILREIFSRDAALRFAGNNAMSGTYRGRDAVMETVRAMLERGPQTEAETVLASEDHILIFFRTTSERDDKTLDVVLAMPMKFNAEGKITEIWFLTNDQRAFDRYWS